MQAALGQALLNPEATVAVEFRWRHRDGSWRALESQGHRLDDDGDVLALATSRDITERRRAEAARLESENALRQSEARYQSLFNNAVLPMYRVRPDGGFEHVNLACAAMLGYDSPADLMALGNISRVYLEAGRGTRLSRARCQASRTSKCSGSGRTARRSGSG